MNARVNDANNNGVNEQNDQMQQFLSMLRNMLAILNSMIGMNRSGDGSTTGDCGEDFGNSSNLGSPQNDVSNETGKSSKSKKDIKSEKTEGSDGEKKTEKNSKSDDAKGNYAVGTEKASAPSGLKGSSIQQAEFEKEGDTSYQANGSQTLDALESSVVTPNGNGIRNENKIKEEELVAMPESSESFWTAVTSDISRAQSRLFHNY